MDDIKVGKLVKINGHGNTPGKPHVVKLYSTLAALKERPFMGFDKTLIIGSEAEYLTLVVRTSYFAYPDILMPPVEAVQIIHDNGTWWIFSHDIDEVLT